MGPGSQIESLHRVLVIADEYQRRPCNDLLFVTLDTNGKNRVASKHRKGGACKGRPFAPPQTLLSLPFPYDAGIESDAGVVEKDLPVDLANIDLHGFARCDRPDGIVHLK